MRVQLLRQIYEEAKTKGFTQEDIPTLTKIIDNLLIVVDSSGGTENGPGNLALDS